MSKSVSLPEVLWESVDAHAEINDGDRSTYIKRLVTSDLEAAGKMPGSPTAELLAAAGELGLPHALQLLTRAMRAKRKPANT